MKRYFVLLAACLLLAGCAIWTRQNESCLFDCHAGKTTQLPEKTLVPVPVPTPKNK